MLQPKFTVFTENINGVHIHRVKIRHTEIDRPAEGRDWTERPEFQPQIAVGVENIDVVCIKCVESRYVAIDLLAGWRQIAERRVFHPQFLVGIEYENGSYAKRLEYALSEESPE
jgi:hypothetical protein